MKYIYIFDCVNCSQFYGEQQLNDKGELLCPECHAPERIDSPFVEKMAVI
jgi:predicted nucleic acid-binding Zn ribbon protein